MPYVPTDETALNLLGTDLNIALQMRQYDAANTSQCSTNQQQQQPNFNRYKTELCRQFSENGDCKYSDKCQFAHGSHELKGVKRHPRYKTDLCKTFHSKGFCPYGPRCHFIHETVEKRDQSKKPQLTPPQLAKNLAQLSTSDEFSLSSCGSSNASSGSVSPTSSSFSASSSPYHAFSLNSELLKSPEKSANVAFKKWSSSASSSSSCSNHSNALLNTKFEASPLKPNKCQLLEDNAFLNGPMQPTNDRAQQFYELNLMGNYNRTFLQNDFFVPQTFGDSWKSVSGECNWPLSSEISAANSQSSFSSNFQFHETKIR